MEREQIIKALYDADTEASAQIAHDAWLVSVKAASELDRKYLLDEYLKFGDLMIRQNQESKREMTKILAEIEKDKLETNQH